MAALPLPPQVARAVVAGGAAGCGAEMVTLAALMSVGSVWVGAADRRRALQDAKLRWDLTLALALSTNIPTVPVRSSICLAFLRHLTSCFLAPFRDTIYDLRFNMG